MKSIKNNKTLSDSELISKYESGKVNMKSMLKQTFEKPKNQSNFKKGGIK